MQRVLKKLQRYVKQLKRSTIIYSKNRVYILSIILHKLFQNISFFVLTRVSSFLSDTSITKLGFHPKSDKKDATCNSEILEAVLCVNRGHMHNTNPVFFTFSLFRVSYVQVNSLITTALVKGFTWKKRIQSFNLWMIRSLTASRMTNDNKTIPSHTNSFTSPMIKGEIADLNYIKCSY